MVRSLLRPRLARWGWFLPASEMTFAELIKGVGYQTACIGKWDVSNRRAIIDRMPNAQGFDYYFGTLGANDSGKGSCYEGGCRVPCIVRWPGKVPQGSVSDAIFATIDFLPTFADLAGFHVPTDRQIDGVDQTDLLLGRSPQGNRDSFFYVNAVRKGKWKYLQAKHCMYGYARDTQREEVITQFVCSGQTWQEAAAVNPAPGQFECPCAACAPAGEPAVAWASKQGDAWVIQVAVMQGGGFGKPVTLSVPQVRLVNPTLLAPELGRYILACGGYAQGRFALYVSVYRHGTWHPAKRVTDAQACSFDPALAESPGEDIYVAYTQTDGMHQNIQMRVVAAQTLAVKETIPVPIGGALTDRVNLNTKPALAFDAGQRLWISWENNHQTSRLEDGDCYTGDRCCGLVCYQGGQLQESKESGKWLFKDKNDHLPTFVENEQIAWSSPVWIQPHVS